jgi:tubulin gamma
MEHGIRPDGILEDYAVDGTDRKDVFFYQVSWMELLLAGLDCLRDFEPAVLFACLK